MFQNIRTRILKNPFTRFEILMDSI